MATNGHGYPSRCMASSWKPDRESLRGRVAVVAGATRGAGRGIACGLAELGATVYCTGRSSRHGGLRSDYPDRPETIEETAEFVDEMGGTGIAVPTDHLDPADVRRLADRVRLEYGRVDVLVNDIWGGELLKGPPPEWDKPIWETDLEDGLRIVRLTVETHLITAHALLPLLVGSPGGLHVEITDGTRAYNDDHYRISAFYDLAKAAANRLALESRPRARQVRGGRGGRDAGLVAFGDDVGGVRRQRGELARGRRATRFRSVRDATVRRTGHRRARCRPRPCPVESTLGLLSRPRRRVRSDRRRRNSAELLGGDGLINVDRRRRHHTPHLE